MSSWLWLLLSIGCEVAGTLSLRASDGFRKRSVHGASPTVSATGNGQSPPGCLAVGLPTRRA